MTHHPVEATAFQQALRGCILQLRQQPRTALAALFDLTAQRLVRYASTLAGNQSDAEDALQAVFSLLARDPRCLTAAQSPWPYLIRSIRNETLRILRKKSRNSSLTHDPTAGNTSASTPSQQLLDAEITQQVRRILLSLPPEQSEVVLLKHWEELTFAEIAESLNLSQNTVASRYRYALEKLQRSLEPFIR
ncbi:MAG: polymerase sigma factor SigV [Planctomycetota bacterium]|jgi:RNA polymerase sigma-70 factor (ECF subfamily)